MSQQGPGGKLPPISPKTTSSEIESSAHKKKKTPRKKRSPRDPESDVEMRENGRPRSSSRPRSTVNSDGSPDREVTDTPRKKKKPKSRPAAHTEDEENIDPGNTAQPKPKKKKKKTTGSSREQLMSGDEVLSDRSQPSQKKKKKKKKKQTVMSETEEEVEEVGLAAELGDLKDDIVEAEKAEKEAAEEPKWAQPAMRSEPVSKVFIEQRSGFKVTDKHKLAKKRMEEEARYRDIPTEIPTQNTIQFALSSHKAWKTLTVFLQGLFAGIALWHIVSVYTLSSSSWVDFLKYYYTAAVPVQSMYFFLYAVCTVAAFDRYDVGRPTRRFWLRAVSMQSGAICCIFYFAGLVLSTSIAAIDDKIGLSGESEDDGFFPWPDEETRDSELNTWRILNLVRGLLPIIGWFIVSLKPSTDRLTKSLEKADINMLDEEQQAYINDAYVKSSGV